MTGDDAMRASDRDRELAAEVLRDAYVAGRIDLGEFHDRTDGAYSARTWRELRDLTADLPTGQVLVASSPDSHTGTARLGPAPQRPFAFIWVMAVIWLAIAVAAHVVAAIPLVLLSLFALRAARWTMPLDQSHPWGAHQSGERTVQTQPLWATQDLGRVCGDQVKRAEGESPHASCGCCAAATTRAK